MIKIIFGAILIFGLGLLFAPAFATGKYNTTNYHNVTNNNYSETVTITSGVSADELSEGLAAAMALGSIGVDFNTLRYQWGAAGAYETGNDSSHFAAGLFKRWEKIDAVFGVRFTQVGDDEYYIFSVGGRL